jgi:hypothetical protein
MGPPGGCRREFGMKWRVMLELIGPDGTVDVREVGGGAAVAFVPCPWPSPKLCNRANPAVFEKARRLIKPDSSLFRGRFRAHLSLFRRRQVDGAPVTDRHSLI